MTGTLGALGSSHALSPLSYYFPYIKENDRDVLSWDVQREKKILPVKSSKLVFFIGNSKLVLKAVVSELPAALENFSS